MQITIAISITVERGFGGDAVPANALYEDDGVTPLFEDDGITILTEDS